LTFISGDSKGNRSGRPRFKNKVRYRTFTFPKVQDKNLADSTIKLPKLGVLKFRKSRNIEPGFKLKTVSVTRKADGYYINLSVEDKSVPEIEIDTVATESNTTGVDVGLEKLYVDSSNNQSLPQKHLRKSEFKLAKLQRKLEDKNRSKKAKRLVRRAISRLHQKIARQRKDWHYNEAHKLTRNCDVLAIEDLKIRNMKRRNKPKRIDGVFVPNGQAASAGMNKSWSDNGVGGFLEILVAVAQKYGTRIIKVNPRGTSQHCSQCLNRVSKTLSDRWHDCDVCNLSCDRDYNSALLIKKLAVGSSQDKNGLRRIPRLLAREYVKSRDSASLLDIVNAVQRVLRFAEKLDKADLATNEEKQSAILYQIIVIGEATKRLSEEFRIQHPEIPWKDIAGMRDILAHQYDRVNLNTLWDAIETDIPELLALIQPLLSDLGGSSHDI
jgi:putative transposase